MVLTPQFSEFDARAKGDIGVKRRHGRVGIVELRSCSIRKPLKIASRNPSGEKPIAQPFKKKERPFGRGAVALAPACFALKRNEGAER